MTSDTIGWNVGCIGLFENYVDFCCGYQRQWSIFRISTMYFAILPASWIILRRFLLTPLLYNPFIVNFGYGKSWGPCTSTHGYVMPMSCRLLEFVDCWDGSVNYVWLDIGLDSF